MSPDHRFIFTCNMITSLAFVELFSSRSAARTFSTGAFRTVVIASAIKGRKLQVTGWTHPSRLAATMPLEK